MNTAITVTDLSKSFKTRHGTVEAVKNVSFSVEPGEIVALLGENGAGKSTLIDMLLGLSLPSAGSVELWGQKPELAVSAAKVSAVLQTGGLLLDLSVKDQVEMVAATFATAPNVRQALKAAGIEDIAQRKIRKCSGGQQQKVKFAIALLGNPDLLLLDEPTAGMDVNAREQFWDSMQAQAKTGKTVIFATHYLEEAQDFAQRIIMVADGELVMDGTPSTIREHTGSRTISFDLPQEPLELTPDQLNDWGITQHRVTGQQHTMHCGEAEKFTLYLLQHHTVTNLEILKPTLAEAFTQLVNRRPLPEKN